MSDLLSGDVGNSALIRLGRPEASDLPHGALGRIADDPNVPSELTWREKPELGLVDPSRQSRLIVSRWIGGPLRGPLEVCADAEDSDHTLSIYNKRSSAELLMNGRSVWNGNITPTPLLLTGPRHTRWKAIFRDSYDTLRIYIPQSLLAECHTEIFGRSPPAQLQLFQVEPLSDSALICLANTLRRARERYDYLGPSFLILSA